MVRGAELGERLIMCMNDPMFYQISIVTIWEDKYLCMQLLITTAMVFSNALLALAIITRKVNLIVECTV